MIMFLTQLSRSIHVETECTILCNEVDLFLFLEKGVFLKTKPEKLVLIIGAINAEFDPFLRKK